MNTKTIAAMIAVLFLYSLSSSAQRDSSHVKGHFDIEIDPLAYAVYKGYSIHGGYTYKHSRFDISAVGVEIPAGFGGEPGFTARTYGGGLKWDYINTKLRGFYFGPQTDLYLLTLRNQSDGAKASLFQASFGLRVGFRFMFGMKKGDVKRMFNKNGSAERGFYLNPWFAPIFNPTKEDKIVGNAVHKSPLIQYFPTIHLGWRF